MPGINWEVYDRIVVNLEKDKEKILKLIDWRIDNRFQRPGLRFKVLEEDNSIVDKEFMTTSSRLIKRLKPIIVNAELTNKKDITLSITKIGENYDTNFIVRDLTK